MITKFRFIRGFDDIIVTIANIMTAGCRCGSRRTLLNLNAGSFSMLISTIYKFISKRWFVRADDGC